MWIGSIRLRVQTVDSVDAGTDSIVSATIVRDGTEIGPKLKLDYEAENDLERGAVRDYYYPGATTLPRSNDETPLLPPGIGQSPMPYPSYGLEFSRGLASHFSVRLEIRGDDMWMKDNIDLFIREIHQRAVSFDTVQWIEDVHWTYVAAWSKNSAMSTDPREGTTFLNLNYA